MLQHCQTDSPDAEMEVAELENKTKFICATIFKEKDENTLNKWPYHFCALAKREKKRQQKRWAETNFGQKERGEWRLEPREKH